MDPAAISAHLAQFAPAEQRQRVRPTEAKGYVRNPHKGITTYQRFNGEASEPMLGHWCDAGPFTRPPWSGTLDNPGYTDTTVAYLRWEWKKFEPVQGQRDWALLDEYLRTAQQRGQTVQFRFNTYDEGFHDWWYWGTGAGKAPNGEPDINDPRWFRHFGDLIREFGERYDGHPLLDTVDVVYGGMWGENGGNATRETQERFIDLYQDAFRTTPLMVMEGDEALAYAATRKLGWRADCFGDLRSGGHPGRVPDHLVWNHQMDRYPFMLFKSGCQDNWRHSPVTFETCWHVGKWFEQGWDLEFLCEQMLQYHTTYFMPKSNAFPEEWIPRLTRLNDRLGYRYVPRQLMLPLRASAGDNLSIDAWIDNVGCAPIYRPYTLVLRFSQEGRSENVPFRADPRTWLPGMNGVRECLRLPRWLRPGIARVDIGMVDAAGTPRVRFAIDEVDAEGWHPLTGIMVEG